jgi:PAS domain S-box-containing protein
VPGKLAPPAIFTSSFFAALLNQAVDMLLVTETGGCCQYLNTGAAALLGFELAEVWGENIRSWVHPQDRSTLDQALLQAQTQIRTTCPPLRLRTAANQWCWLAGELLPVDTGQDAPSLAFLLRQVSPPAPEVNPGNQERHLEYDNALFQNHPDAILTLDPAGLIIKGNGHALKISGYSPEEYFGLHFSQLLPAAEQEQVAAAFLRSLQGNSLTLETRLLTRNGQLKDISVTSIPIRNQGRTEAIQCIVKDITEEKQKQRALENLSLVASKTTNAVLIADSQRRIEWVNEGFTQLTGFTRGEVEGLPSADMLLRLGADAATVAEISRKLDANQPFSAEIQHTNKKGEAIWFLTEVTPVVDEQGQVVKYISIRTDITEKKNRERELLHLTQDLCHQNRDLQQFTYIVSHNLRAPIANALGLVNLLTDPGPSRDLLPEITKNLKTSVWQLDAVIKDINLILSIRDNKDTLSREALVFREVYDQVMHTLAVSLLDCQGSIHLEVAPDYTLRSHKAYLFSILYNLLSNAIKYRSPERPLQIQLQCVGTPEGGTCISCSDNGLGLNLHTAGKDLFRPYKRFHRDIPGRGIGLYLVKTHIETLGGEIEVISSPNKGTRFLIYLP